MVFANMREITVKKISMTPPAFSLSKNSLNSPCFSFSVNMLLIGFIINHPIADNKNNSNGTKHVVPFMQSNNILAKKDLFVTFSRYQAIL
jgi:hypothetical protein